jgi:hypothetical protein
MPKATRLKLLSTSPEHRNDDTAHKINFNFENTTRRGSNVEAEYYQSEKLGRGTDIDWTQHQQDYERAIKRYGES